MLSINYEHGIAVIEKDGCQISFSITDLNYKTKIELINILSDITR